MTLSRFFRYPPKSGNAKLIILLYTRIETWIIELA